MSEDREILLLSDAPQHAREAMASAARRAGARAIEPRDVAEARTVLHARQVRAVVVDAAAAGFLAMLRTLRDEPRLYAVPALVVVPDASTDSFEEAHELGADGVVVAGGWDELTECLRALLDGEHQERAPIVHGTVLVAHADVQKRRALARGLRRLGFGVTFAADRCDLEAQIEREDPSAVIVASELAAGGGAPGEDLAQVRDLPDRPTVVTAPLRHLRALERATADLAHVSVAPASCGPAGLVFLLGELLRPNLADARSSRRLLASTLCFFRQGRTRRERHGVTHNVSMDGLYVRAVAPPPVGADLWMELVPPGRDELVQLRGEVVWRRGAVPAPGGPVPPGFGVRILAEACAPPDLGAYRAAYAALLEGPRGARPARSRAEAPAAA